MKKLARIICYSVIVLYLLRLEYNIYVANATLDCYGKVITGLINSVFELEKAETEAFFKK
jgi:hypothetical protein